MCRQIFYGLVLLIASAQSVYGQSTVVVISDGPSSWWTDFKTLVLHQQKLELEKRGKEQPDETKWQFELTIRSSKEQLDLVRSLLKDKQLGGIAIAPIDQKDQELANQLREVRKADIPVILLKRDFNLPRKESFRDFAFHFDPVGQGKLLSLSMYSSLFPEAKDDGRDGFKFVQLITSPNSKWQTDIADAAAAKAGQLSGRENARYLDCSNPQKTKRAVQRVLKDIPDGLVVYTLANAKIVHAEFESIPKEKRPKIFVVELSRESLKMVKEREIFSAMDLSVDSLALSVYPLMEKDEASIKLWKRRSIKGSVVSPLSILVNEPYDDRVMRVITESTQVFPQVWTPEVQQEVFDLYFPKE